MHADRHDFRNSRARWDIILGVLFVMSFLGVTLALAISNVIAAPDGSDRAPTTTSSDGFLK